MDNRFKKRFTLLICTLLLLQEAHGFLKVQHDEENLKRRNVELEDKQVEINAVSAIESRKKRGALTVVLLAISGFSAGTDIYKQEIGCRLATPGLQGKVNEADRKQKELVTLKNKINLAWGPVVAKERYINRLDADMLLIRNLTFLKDETMVEIVQLIDGAILTKFDGVKRQLENEISFYNDSSLPDPQNYNKKFFTQAQYALSLSLKLGSIGLYLGGKFLLPKITQSVTRAYARNLASENPSLITRWINAGSNTLAAIRAWSATQLQSIQRSLTLGWHIFRIVFPSTARALQGIARVSSAPFRFIYRTYQAHKINIIRGAKAGLVLFLIAYEIWGLVKFHQQCDNNLRNVNNILVTMEENKQNMTRTFDRVTRLMTDYKTYYNQMKGNLTSDAFMNFTAEVVKLGENAKDQTDRIVTGTRDIQRYINEIKNANDEQTDRLNKLLISALARINYKLECVRSKLSIIATLAKNCADGTKNFDSLYVDAKDAERRKVTAVCIANNYMSKPEIKNITEESMLARKNNIICVRNSHSKRDAVCGKWYLDLSPSEIEKVLKKTENLTLADVLYFISICPPGEVQDVQKTAICSEKANFATPADVAKKYYKFELAQVHSAYNNCALSVANKNTICSMKKDGHSLTVVQKKLGYYPPDNVSVVYKSCVAKITPFDAQFMCTLQKNNMIKYGTPAGKSLWDPYVRKYGQAQVEAHIKTCAPASGDWPNLTYRKYQELFDLPYITPNDVDKDEMCALQNNGIKFWDPSYHEIWKIYFTKFGKKVVETLLKSCTPSYKDWSKAVYQKYY